MLGAIRSGMSTTRHSEGAAAAHAKGHRERLFRALPSSAAKLQLGLGFLGSAALGAGFYGAWLAEEPVAFSGILLLAGAICIALSFVNWGRRAAEVRVGPLGVISGDPAEARRLPWCDVLRVRVTPDALELEASGDRRVSVPLPAHAAAAARILAEASVRIPERVDVSPKAHERLPPLREDDAEQVAAARLQLAGRRCAVSGKSITLERDARLCDNCAALYHVERVPLTCASCQKPLQATEARAAS